MSTIVASRRPVDPTPREGTEGEAPGWGETIGASFRVAEDDQELTQLGRNADAYKAMLETLGDLGVDTSEAGPLYRDAESSGYALRTFRVYDRDAIHAEAMRQRAGNPKLFQTLPATREEYDTWVATRGDARSRDRQIVQRGSGVAGFIGGVGSAMTDPINLATAPVGAGTGSLVRTVIAEAIIGAVTEIPNLPGTARARARMGEDFTTRDAVEQVASSAAASGVLGGGVRGIEIAAPRVGAAVTGKVDAGRAKLESVIADNWDRLPETVRARWTKGADIPEADLPDLAEALIGRANMSVDERGAIDAMRRDAEIAAVSPFKPGMAGDAAHRERLDEAVTALLRPVEVGARGRGLPTRPGMPAPSRADLRSGSALSSPGSTAPRAALKSRIRQVESGGDDVARNPLSSATGRYQFTSDTWLAYYKRRFGAQGLTDAQILAKRGDGRLQETLMDDLTADNARFLRTVGEAETAGNLYLTHFAGKGGAGRLFRADPDADAGAVLGAGVVKANPWMRGMTAGDVIAWAHRKMDEAAPRRAGARSELADGEGAWRDRLQEEIDRIDAESDAARAARAAADPVGEAMGDGARSLPSTDNAFVPVDVDVDAVTDVPAPLAREGAADAMPPREAALLPALRAEIAGTARLSDVEGLAKRLEASVDEIKITLQRLAESDRTIVANKQGVFRRAPTDRGPVDAYKFLARAGGLTPHGLDVGVEYIPKAKLVGAEKNEGHDPIGIFNTKARSKSGGRRDQSILIPGAGPLIRPNGMSIDDAGELLFEAGYLRGEGGGRPSTAETIAYLEQGMSDGPARLLPGNRETELDAYVPPETLADMTEQMREWAAYQEVDLDADDVEALARLMMRDDIANEDAALAALIDDAVLDALDDMRYESGDYDADLSQALDHFDAGSRVGGRAPDPRDAGEGGARGEAGDDWPEPVDLESEAARIGLDGASDALSLEISASVRHDLDMLYGEADMAPDMAFYLDENGDARSWADIAAELDADEIELATIKACL